MFVFMAKAKNIDYLQNTGGVKDEYYNKPGFVGVAGRFPKRYALPN